MRLATIITDGQEYLAICLPTGIVSIRDLNREFRSQWPETMEQLLTTDRLTALNDWYRQKGGICLDPLGCLVLKAEACAYAPLYRHPPKLWGIGLNYSAHARDLSESAPTSAPASFMKPYTAIIGHGDEIRIPRLSEKTTAEAELGIIIGRRCKDVPREKWKDVVAGFTAVIDMTAEDILRQNPRYLTMSKSFDTFFSFGPQMVTSDEVDDVLKLMVSTVINGRMHAENTVDHMTFPPGAVHIHHGDNVECRITGFEPLKNPVIDLKRPGV
ncbi:MAG: fumarylacetoacetate hydrolase family protein [Desulfatirhabdiaceae bacterium]|nr:fumarylacetoacetate hydrolase family protein [Desulfatirhabdiaceae bacterium]